MRTFFPGTHAFSKDGVVWGYSGKYEEANHGHVLSFEYSNESLDENRVLKYQDRLGTDAKEWKGKERVLFTTFLMRKRWLTVYPDRLMIDRLDHV